MAAARGKRNRASPEPSVPLSEAGRAASRAPGVPDLVRRAITAGLSGLFNTNEAVRRAVGDAMPREWVDFAVDQSERTRAEFIDRLAGEIARTIENLEIVEMAERFFEGKTIEIRAEIQLRPKEGRVRAERLSVEAIRNGKRR